MLDEREERRPNPPPPSNHWHANKTVAVIGCHGREEWECIEKASSSSSCFPALFQCVLWESPCFLIWKQLDLNKRNVSTLVALLLRVEIIQQILMLKGKHEISHQKTSLLILVDLKREAAIQLHLQLSNYFCPGTRSFLFVFFVGKVNPLEYTIPNH